MASNPVCDLVNEQQRHKTMQVACAAQRQTLQGARQTGVVILKSTKSTFFSSFYELQL